MMAKILFSREEMTELNIKTLNRRGIQVTDIAEIAFNQQSRYTKDIVFNDCVESVLKILSFRDVFHHIQLFAEIDRLAEENKLEGPIGDILRADLGLFGIDELVGLDIASLYGTIGQTNFGDIDVNKPGLVNTLNEGGKKEGVCHTFMDDIVGAIAAAASTRIAQMYNEDKAHENPNVTNISIYDL